MCLDNFVQGKNRKKTEKRKRREEEMRQVKERTGKWETKTTIERIQEEEKK